MGTGRYWPFTDKDRCPKCGQSFHNEFGRRPLVTYRPDHGAEHLECECPTCDYTWDEPTVDAADG